MTKEQKGILIKFGLYILTCLIITIIGITNIFADEYLFDYNYVQIYYDNSGSSLSGVGQSWNESLQAYVSNSIPTTANSYGAGVAFNSPIPIIANHTYTMSFYFLERSNIALSSKNHIAVGSSAYNAAISHYANSSYYATTQYSNVANGSILSFVFKPTTNGQWIFVPWTTTSNTNQTYVFQSVIIDDLGDSGVSQSEINTSLSNQNTIINSYITNSQNAITSNDNTNRDLIINNQNNNRQAIIDNQNANNEALIENDNANTDKIIEENKKNFNDCHNSNNLWENNNYYTQMTTDNYTIQNNGFTFTRGSMTGGRYISKRIAVEKDKIYYFGGESENYSSNFYLAIYRNNVYSELIKSSYATPITYTATANEDLYFTYIISSGLSSASVKDIYVSIDNFYEPYGEEVCVNKLDEANKTSKGILGKLGDLLSYINPLSENFFVYKLIELLGNLLKSLFVPSSTFIKNWYDDFKAWFELKLGFIATPFTLFVDFIETFLNLEDTNLVINIPQITVPNFENYVLIEARTFNWGELLNSKQEFRTLWTLYLDFIDVFLILNFLGLCETKYNRIFGGDTTPYEYYTTEETYNINDETGEATNHMLRQRTTRRERVK